MNSNAENQGLFGSARKTDTEVSFIRNTSIGSASYVQGISFVGALVGSGGSLTITNCTNAAEVVNSDSSSMGGVGGIAGQIYAPGSIAGCSNTGTVSKTVATTMRVSPVVSLVPVLVRQFRIAPISVPLRRVRTLQVASLDEGLLHQLSRTASTQDRSVPRGRVLLRRREASSSPTVSTTKKLPSQSLLQLTANLTRMAWRRLSLPRR